MRTLTLIITLICLTHGLKAAHPNTDSKSSDTKRWRAGFVVTLNGDTMRGMVKINDYLDKHYDFQRLVAFSANGANTQYDPTQLQSFSYADNQNTVTMQSVSSPEGDGHVFLHLYYSGSCKVYGFMITEIKGANNNPAGDGIVHSSLFPTEKKYLQVGGSQFYQLKRVNFKKCIQEAFAGCPRIQARISDKAYSYDNLQALVDDYNKGLK